jgi:hypothetical protein
MWFIITIFIALVLAACIWVVRRFWEPLLAVGCLPAESRLWRWALKGIAAPMLMWLGFNFVLIPGHIATVPKAALAGASADVCTRIALELLFPALPVVASCWAAATLAWLGTQLVLHTESRNEILGAGSFWGLVLAPVAACILYVFGWPGVGVALMVVLLPVLRDLLALGQPKRLPPVYERALERLKRGEHSAAEMEIIRQLEKREEDFEGWMLLAGVYAQHFGDLAQAERTVREVCGQPSITRAQYCAALMQLGEWHLQLRFDASAARAVWSEICKRFPHTEFADTARRRIERLTRAPAGESVL